MIKRFDISEIGRFNKTHGIKGELNASLDIEHEFFQDNNCIIIEINGIFVPFFIESYRSKGIETMLIKLEDINTEIDANLFINKTIYCRKNDLNKFESENKMEDGEYADFYIGYEIVSSDNLTIGQITDIEDYTKNALFIVKNADNLYYIPITPDFIEQIDDDKKIIYMDLPDGLITINN